MYLSPVFFWGTEKMFLGLSLLVVGVVLCLNGIWQMGRIQDREIILINAVAALVFFATVLLIALAAQQPADLLDAGMTLLFGTTYLWVAYNRTFASSGEGLGWFSGFVALTAAPMVLRVLAQADGLFDVWLAGLLGRLVRAVVPLFPEPRPQTRQPPADRHCNAPVRHLHRLAAGAGSAARTGGLRRKEPAHCGPAPLLLSLHRMFLRQA